MNRASTAVLGGFVAVGLAILALPRGDYRMKEPHRAPVLLLPSAVPSALASITPPPIFSDAPTVAADAPPEAAEDDETSKVGQTMPDGSPVPKLPDTPKHVRFGVVLVSYAGAQGPRSARPKPQAESLARELAEQAKSDFAAAVKKGDPGSLDDAGTMYRGILEPAPEYVLFTLEPDQVGGPVDTPRGYWIVRRLK